MALAAVATIDDEDRDDSDNDNLPTNLCKKDKKKKLNKHAAVAMKAAIA